MTWLIYILAFFFLDFLVKNYQSLAVGALTPNTNPISLVSLWDNFSQFFTLFILLCVVLLNAKCSKKLSLFSVIFFSTVVVSVLFSLTYFSLTYIFTIFCSMNSFVEYTNWPFFLLLVFSINYFFSLHVKKQKLLKKVINKLI